MQIVEVFSSAIVPEQVIRESNIKDLIKDMAAAQASVKSTTQKLDDARNAQKDGNFVTNWWNDRSDAVQDAQINLNRSIGSLTEKSSQLLIINTAISKVLHDQQGILLRQQDELQRQAGTLHEQNNQILEQQKELARQQQEINAANKGLMEAKGISQEQALKLVGCVTLVTEAEKRIDAANRDLTQSVERYVQDSTAGCLERLEELNAGLEQTLQTNIQAFEGKMDEQHSAIRRLGDDLASYAKTMQDAHEAIHKNLLDMQQAGKNVETKLETATQALERKLGFATQEMERKLDTAKQQIELAQQIEHETFSGTQVQMSADMRTTADGLRSVESQVSRLQQELKGSRRTQIMATATVAAIAIAALAWQAVPVFLQASTLVQ